MRAHSDLSAGHGLSANDHVLQNPILSSITRNGPTGTFLGAAVTARNTSFSLMILRIRSLNTSTVKSSPAQRR